MRMEAEVLWRVPAVGLWMKWWIINDHQVCLPGTNKAFICLFS